MKVTNVEKIFQLINETADIIREELDCTELEALAETGENWFHGEVLQPELSELASKKLKKKYQELLIETLDREDIRKGWQLAILKAMRTNVQANHQMTPDAIGILFAYLLDKFTGNKKDLAILDLAVGTGNLLFTVLNSMGDSINAATGVEVDDTLIRLAYTGANLLGQPVQLLHQDSLQPLLINPADIVICDLPIGYYPNEEGAASFKLKADEGLSFAHHLFIEQSMTYAKDGAYLFFLIPNNLFLTEEAKALHQFINETGFVQGIIQLPESMFNSKQTGKSIFILQKKGNEVKAPKQVLMVNMPKMSDRNATATVLKKMDDWINTEKR